MTYINNIDLPLVNPQKMPLSSEDIRTWYIYKITSPTGRIYIGVTFNLTKRKYNYQANACKHQVALQRSLHKYGFKSHSFEVIDKFTSSINYAFGKELFWIRSFMSNSGKYPHQRGLNMTNGGRGSIGRVVTEAQKEHLRKLNTGKKVSDETRIRLSEALKGRKVNKWTRERKEKMSELKLRLNYRHTEETKRKIGEASKGNKYNLGRKQTAEVIEARTKHIRGKKFRLGKKFTPEQRERRSIIFREVRGVPVIKLSKDMVEVGRYNSVANAAEFNSIKKKNLEYAITVGKIIDGFTYKKINKPCQ